MAETKTRENYRKLALDKALQYAETRTLNPKEFLDLMETIYQFLTNKTKNVKQQ